MFTSLFQSSMYHAFKTMIVSKKEKNIIIDPMSCIIKLGILGFYPEGTKICITKNNISYDEPSIFQGTFRFIKGDGHDDLHNLFNPICRFIKWYYQLENKDKYGNINNLCEYSINGLLILKETYHEHTTIRHTIDYYIQILKCNTEICQEQLESIKEDEQNEIHIFLKDLWSGNEVKIIIDIFNEFIKKKEIKKNHTEIDDLDDRIHLLNTITQITQVKEKKLHNFLNRHTTILN
jgi:hypothetical protein